MAGEMGDICDDKPRRPQGKDEIRTKKIEVRPT